MEYTPQELALAIRKLIENHPLNWEQGVWYGFTSMSSTVDSIRRDLEEGTCGTTACVAGWAAILVSPDGTKLADYDSCPSGNLDALIYPNGTVKRIRAVAAKALGISAGKRLSGCSMRIEPEKK